MTDISRAAVDALLRGVTPGPWEAESGHEQQNGQLYWQVTDGADAIMQNQFCWCQGDHAANARFIAATRELVPALRAALDEAEARADAAERKLKKLVKRFTPRPLRYAPKDRLIIGVERPPYEETTFFYDLIWSGDEKQFVSPFTGSLNGASHFLDPRELIGLPPQERLSMAERQKANQVSKDAAYE